MHVRREKYQSYLSVKKVKSLRYIIFPLPPLPPLPPFLPYFSPSQVIVLPLKLTMRIELASMLQHVEGRALNSVALYMHMYVLHVKLIAYFP